MLSAILALAGSSVAASAAVVAAGFVAVTNGSGSLQISAFRLDGSLERRLTTGPANHHYPSLSPDGTELLYTGDEGGYDEIYRIHVAEPTAAVRITAAPLMANSASWSPDGRSIVYSALVPGSSAYQIFIANADGTNPVQVTHTTNSGNAQPEFSPDGARIAYINGHETAGQGPESSTITGIANRIWVIGADGSGAAPLTPGPLDAYPAWLDAKTVMFARSGFLSDSSQILSVGLDGREQLQSPIHQYLIEPKPQPDGRSYGATMETGSELHLVRVSRNDRATLTAPESGEFVIDRLAIPASDGSSFTIAWILARGSARAPAGPVPYPIYGLGGSAILLLILVAASSYRKSRQKN